MEVAELYAVVGGSTGGLSWPTDHLRLQLDAEPVHYGGLHMVHDGKDIPTGTTWSSDDEIGMKI